MVMQDTRDPVEIRLTPELLEEVKEVANLRGSTQGLLKLWEILLGHPLEDHEGSVTPWEYKIPQEQWKEISTSFIQADGVSGGLLMMNSGPSSIEES